MRLPCVKSTFNMRFKKRMLDIFLFIVYYNSQIAIDQSKSPCRKVDDTRGIIKQCNITVYFHFYSNYDQTLVEENVHGNGKSLYCRNVCISEIKNNK